MCVLLHYSANEIYSAVINTTVRVKNVTVL